MTVVVHGPLARVAAGGVVYSYAPDETIEVDDNDAAEVAYFHNLATAGLATIGGAAP
jgi:hypothetical protein